MHPTVMSMPYEPDDCHVMPDAEPNGSMAVTFVLRLCTLGLALASAIVMVTASDCTISGDGDDDGTTVTYHDFPPFVYLVACNITATILEAAAVFLQFVKGGFGDDEEAPVLLGVALVVVDVAVQVLLYTSAGGTFAAVAAYGDQISGCSGDAGNFCQQVHTAKLIGFGAGLAAALAAVVKDVPLPFSVCRMSS